MVGVRFPLKIRINQNWLVVSTTFKLSLLWKANSGWKSLDLVFVNLMMHVLDLLVLMRFVSAKVSSFQENVGE